MLYFMNFMLKYLHLQSKSRNVCSAPTYNVDVETFGGK